MTFDASELAEFAENIMNIDILHGGLRPDHLVLPLAGYSQFLKDPGYAIDDAPPAHLLPNETELLTIDEVLRNYDPKNQRITLFQPNIQKAAHILECDEWDLTYVIRYHEYAHAAIHLAVTAEDHLKAIQDKRFASHDFGH